MLKKYREKLVLGLLVAIMFVSQVPVKDVFHVAGDEDIQITPLNFQINGDEDIEITVV